MLIRLSVISFVAMASLSAYSQQNVTFNYKNDQAKEVFVDVQFAGKQPMTKDAATGVWTATLGPAAPDMYPYHFEVDGISVMDPENDQYFPNEGFKNSLLEIPSANGVLPHDIRPVPHGRMVYIHYFSKSLGVTNQAVVYLPPSYQQRPDQRYPVFYLISGTTDTEEVYYKVGRANYILDNLIAEGKAKEMIIVMPYGNPYKLLPAPPDFSKIPVTGFGGDVFSRDLTSDLMPYIEQQFRTINDADHRAIGGFSRGGNQALANGLLNLDKFSYLCSYSSFTSTDLPGVYDQPAATNAKIRLFWLGVGTDDFLYGTARDYMEFLDKHGIRAVKEYTSDKFGHTWMNAKYFLSKTLPLLFNPEASAEAMNNAQPTLAATGKEAQFTPGVMARLFPKPIVSPEYQDDSVLFRFKAPKAKEVLLSAEVLGRPIAMQCDSDGIWTASINEHLYEAFTYYYIVDGTPVADPENMYLAPSKGFKPSICYHPSNPFHYMTMGDMPHGVVFYSLKSSGLSKLGGLDMASATYYPAGFSDKTVRTAIRLIPGKNDTAESWFKIGGADAMADTYIVMKKVAPFIMTTGELPSTISAKEVLILKADDYSNWPERRHALESLLDSLMLQSAVRGDIQLNLPLFQTKYTADPAPLVVGDTLFLYTSHDASPEDIPDLNEKSSAGFFMYDWLLWSTTDMVNWTEHGAVASLKDIPWRSRENGAWAIQTVERNGKYYLYAPLHGHGIAVLVSDSPYGPFKDPLGKPLVWDQSNWFDIDPSVYTDDDGQAYLYWGNPHTFYARLNDDMISLKDSVTRLPHIRHYQEGPWFYKRDGHYYLGFASTCCPEALGYAMSDSPVGPWEWKGYIMRPTLRDRGNHPGICDFKGHSYVFGQNYDLMHLETFVHHERRSVSAAELTYQADGTIAEVPYWLDQQPLKQLHWLNPYQRVEAETMALGYGLKTAKMGIANTGVVADMPSSTGKRNMYVYDIDDQEFIKLRGVDFAAGAKRFQISAAAEGNCMITLRLDSQDGPVIGTVNISDTKSLERYRSFRTKVNGTAGVHDLYLCFSQVTGSVHLDWYQFGK
ncbi:MAG: family 43 glycosylhydrolase [Prevotella sp.]|nr:family 43 glycosylhydrolase [Prevotella sp.]